jgi:DNA-binding NtrC family response regulator
MSSPIHLLIIDGDLVNRKFIQKALTSSSLNLNVSFIGALEEVEENFRIKECDLIITEYNLRTNSGVGALKYLFEEKKVDVPVIVVSTGLTESIVKQILKYRASDFLTKNLITPENLSLSISKALIIFEEQKNLRGEFRKS